MPNEYELADRFGVSRGTIREAGKLLVSRGVLRVKHAINGLAMMAASTLVFDVLKLAD